MMILLLAQAATLEFKPAGTASAKDIELASRTVEARIRDYGYTGLTVKVVQTDGVTTGFCVESKTPITEKMAPKIRLLSSCDGVPAYRLVRALTKAEAEQFEPPNAPDGTEWLEPFDGAEERVLVLKEAAVPSAEITFEPGRPRGDLEVPEDAPDGVVWTLSKVALDKLKKMTPAQQNGDLALVVDGKAYSVHAVKKLLKAIEAKEEIRTSKSEADDALFLVMVKNPLPARFAEVTDR